MEGLIYCNVLEGQNPKSSYPGEVKFVALEIQHDRNSVLEHRLEAS